MEYFKCYNWDLKWCNWDKERIVKYYFNYKNTYQEYVNKDSKLVIVFYAKFYYKKLQEKLINIWFIIL